MELLLARLLLSACFYNSAANFLAQSCLHSFSFQFYRRFICEDPISDLSPSLF
ncbi:hypothetical protein OROHE_019050 [Orobanche hederae]